MRFPRLPRKIIRRAGFDIIRYDFQNHPVARLVRLLSLHGIDYVIDVGANEGQYARIIRDGGYRGAILSIEPTRQAFKILEWEARTDDLWMCRRAAVGERIGKVLVNIAKNSQSSSILGMMPLHKESAPGSEYVAQEEVDLITVDSLLSSRDGIGSRVFLKIDAQGYENMILKGTIETLPMIRGLELEMSLAPLYDGELLFYDLHHELETLGFTLMTLEPVFFSARTHQVMQLNGVYFNLKDVVTPGK